MNVKSLNSITSVARRNPDDFAMVFTSGITPFVSEEVSGPTEKFIQDYGTRAHHMAFRTGNIEATIKNLKKDGMKFLLDLVGSEEEGTQTDLLRTFILNPYRQRIHPPLRWF